MMFEYKVVPAPTRGQKAKGIKGIEARFALALQTVMNDLGAEGWEYQRTDTLPVEERQGLTGKSTSYQNMLVFRRTLAAETSPKSHPKIAALIEDQSAATHEADIQADAQEAVVVVNATPKTTTPPVVRDVAAPAPTVAAPTVAAPVEPGPFAAPIARPAKDTTTANASNSAANSPENTPGTKSLVDEALKTESFAFPWDRRAKTNKTDATDSQPVTE